MSAGIAERPGNAKSRPVRRRAALCMGVPGARPGYASVSGATGQYQAGSSVRSPGPTVRTAGQ